MMWLTGSIVQLQQETFNLIMGKALRDSTSFNAARVALIKSDMSLQGYVGGSKSYAGLKICDIVADSGKLHAVRSGGVKTLCPESKEKIIAAAIRYLL